MDHGFYKCTDPTTKTSDWLLLNFDSVPGQVFGKLLDDNGPEEVLNRVNPTTMDCETCSGIGEVIDDDEESSEDGSPAAMECEDCDGEGKVLDEDADLHGWPVAWNCMWQGNDHADFRAALDAAGFVVYEFGPIAKEAGFDGLVFGVDGGGYDFYSSHWIPLRAELCLLVSRMFEQKTRLQAIMRVLEKECEGISGEVEAFRRRFGEHYIDENRVEIQQ